jgi:DNA-binding CsgD family transcriptional regulator
MPSLSGPLDARTRPVSGSASHPATIGLRATARHLPASRRMSASPAPHDVTIRAHQLIAFATAHAACLTPFEYPDLDAWRTALCTATRDFLGGTAAQASLFPLDGVPRLHSPEIDPVHITTYLRDWLPHDLVLDHVTRHGIRTFGRSSLAREVPALDAAMRTSPLYQEFYRDIGTVDAIGIVQTGELNAQLVVHHSRFGDPAFADGVPLMRLLEPAFLAGVRAIVDAKATNGAFTRLIDDLPGAIGLYAPDGRRLHWNTALRRLLEESPAAKSIERALGALARELAPTGSRARTPSASPTMCALVASHRITGTIARLGIDGSPPLIMLRVDPLAAAGVTAAGPVALTTRSPDAIALLQPLTPRQRDVAVLIASGHSNAEVARQLQVSPFTARRHTEQVLARLGVHSRLQAAALLAPLLRPDPPRDA